MERRRYGRQKFRFKDELKIGNDSFDCHIVNLSARGAHVELASSKTLVKCDPGTKVELEFNLGTGEPLNLQGDVMWCRTDESPPDELIRNIGIEFKNPPEIYLQFIKTFHLDD